MKIYVFIFSALSFFSLVLLTPFTGLASLTISQCWPTPASSEKRQPNYCQILKPEIYLEKRENFRQYYSSLNNTDIKLNYCAELINNNHVIYYEVGCPEIMTSIFYSWEKSNLPLFTRIFTFALHLVNFYVAPLLLGIAPLLTLWGIFQLFKDKSRASGKKKILYGILLFILTIFFWVLINLIYST